MSTLNFSNINKYYGNTPAVVDFNLSIQEGEFVSFLGPSGCGKTTTLRMVAGFEQPTSGSLKINDAEILTLPANKRNVGMVFQSYALFPNMTVADNIGFGLKVAKKSKKEIDMKVDQTLNLIRMPELRDRYPSQLSGGQQQRVALARALAIEPKVLLLDEPLSALDAKIRVELRAEIRRIQQQLNITTIYVTHDQEEALSLSDRIVVMDNSHIEQVGTPAQIYNDPASKFVAEFIGHINLLPVTVTNSESGEVSIHGNTVKVKNARNFENRPTMLAVRPEELNPGTVVGANNLTGIVESVTYLGSIIRIRLDIGGEGVSIDLFNDRKFISPQIGQSYDFNFPVEASWLI